MALQRKYGPENTHQFANFTMPECGIYLQYKKQSKKDPTMPKDLAKRRARCLEWMDRSSPIASPDASDDEGEPKEDEGDDMDGVVAGLLGLASTPNINIGLEGESEWQEGGDLEV